jgi:hypothetical protein
LITGGFNRPRAGCLRIGAVDLIPLGTGAVPPRIVYLAVGFVKYLPLIWGEGCQPFLKRRTPAPVMWPH